jgi:hypothetical protein
VLQVRKRVRTVDVKALADISDRPRVSAAVRDVVSNFIERARETAVEGNHVFCSNPGCGAMEVASDPFKRCSACRLAAAVYCSHSCQKAHWPAHKRVCRAAASAGNA